MSGASFSGDFGTALGDGDEPRFPLVLVDVATEETDEVGALLFELGAEGVEERDDQTLARGPGAGRVTLVGSFADRAAAEEAVEAIDARFSPRFDELCGDGWRDAWKRHFVPFSLTSRITVRPPWQEYRALRPDEIVLELEPGRAFGTGLHATTALVARALETRAVRLGGARVLDAGTGSGILALVALAFGASHVRAIDIDTEAIDVTRENAERNAAGGRLEADTAPLSSLAGTYEVVVANIEARVLTAMADDLARRVAAGGVLILSGILKTQGNEVRGAFHGWLLEEELSDGEWVALVLRRA